MTKKTSIDFVETPREISSFPPTSELTMSEEQVNHVAEIFNTPLQGAYNWDYTAQDNRILKLYELGKKLNWNASIDIDWDQTPDFQDRPAITEAARQKIRETRDNSLFSGFEPWEKMTEDEIIEWWRHQNSWSLSQFLHGEQGALLVASQLVSCAPTFNAKMYAASQTFDEARHVEVFNRYLQRKIGFMYPVARSLKALLDKILTDPRWDLKFIGMQIIIEGLALAAFNSTKQNTDDPVLREICHYVIRDEARHVTFGVNYLEEHVASLNTEEVEERAVFAYEACVVMRERLLATDVYRHFGWPVEEAMAIATEGEMRARFRNLIFARVVPNLKRIGLLTEKIRPKFEALGLLEFESLPDDGILDWDELSKPLSESA